MLSRVENSLYSLYLSHWQTVCSVCDYFFRCLSHNYYYPNISGEVRKICKLKLALILFVERCPHDLDAPEVIRMWVLYYALDKNDVSLSSQGEPILDNIFLRCSMIVLHQWTSLSPFYFYKLMKKK